MKIGYAKVSTREQSFDLQMDALKTAGCTKICREKISGARAERPVLDELITNIRGGDVLVIWKLDRQGRSLKHLVELVADLIEKDVGLLSFNDPIDTTTAQGRLVIIFKASRSQNFHADRNRRPVTNNAKGTRWRPNAYLPKG